MCSIRGCLQKGLRALNILSWERWLGFANFELQLENCSNLGKLFWRSLGHFTHSTAFIAVESTAAYLHCGRAHSSLGKGARGCLG